MARMAWVEACQLDRSLLSLDHFFTIPPEYAQTLTGGLTNRCWKIVEHDGAAFVWRPTTQITKAFSISRFQEFQILSAIEKSRLGPKPIHVSEHGLLVEWIEGTSLTDGLPFDQLLASLVQVHELDKQRIPIAPFNYTARVDHYWMLLQSHYKTTAASEIYQQWRKPPILADVGSALCHFDLAGYNMVDTGEQHRIIDWEYAAIADPRLDLMLSISVAEEAPEQAVFHYCKMRGIDGIDDWVEGVLAWKPRASMMAMLWYLLAHQLWGDDYYLEQAQQMQCDFCH